VNTTTLYRAWDRHGLGRPANPPSWTRRLLNDRGLAEQAFVYARQTSILAAASEFQTSAPMLRRAFDRHGFGHPHAGLDPEELRRRWNEQPGPDHRNRIQRREYRARRAAERRAARAATPSERSAVPPNQRARRSRDNRDEERSR
jgi:hypothetical protein